jgi:hypothetical protein
MAQVRQGAPVGRQSALPQRAPGNEPLDGNRRRKLDSFRCCDYGPGIYNLIGTMHPEWTLRPFLSITSTLPGKKAKDLLEGSSGSVQDCESGRPGPGDRHSEDVQLELAALKPFQTR